VERLAELRREHFVRGVPIKELVRRTRPARKTIRVALRLDRPPVFAVPERPSKLEPFKDEIHRLLSEDPKLPSVRIRELLVGVRRWQDDPRRLPARRQADLSAAADASADGVSAG